MVSAEEALKGQRFYVEPLINIIILWDNTKRKGLSTPNNPSGIIKSWPKISLKNTAEATKLCTSLNENRIRTLL